MFNLAKKIVDFVGRRDNFFAERHGLSAVKFLDDNFSARAVKYRPPRLFPVERAFKFTAPASKIQIRVDVIINAAGNFRLDFADAGNFAQKIVEPAGAVNPNVEERAALPRLRVVRFARQIHFVAQSGFDAGNFANLSQRSFNFRVQRHKARFHRLHEKFFLRAGNVSNFRHFSQIQSRGLFAQNSLASLQRANRKIFVQRVRQRNVHRVNFFVRQKQIVTGVNFLGAKFFSKILALRRTARTHRVKLTARLVP